MSAAVTPLEALRRLYEVARKVDASESGKFETLLQGELAVAESVLRDAAAPVVPVAAQPVAWGLLSIQEPELTNDQGLADYWARKGRIVTALYAAPSLEAQPAGEVARDAARLDFLDRCVMNHRCISAERDRDGTVGSPTYGDLPTVTIFTIPSQHKKGLGLRGAIDAAMAQGDKA